jgi:predicted MFS family arabinose efflux permease
MKTPSRWWTVLAGSIGCAVGAGIVVLYAFPLFAQGFQQEFGWTRDTYANCLSIFLLSSGLGTVTLGIAIRRFGVRRAASAYVLLFGAACAGVALLPASPAAFYTLFVLIGLGGAAATALPYAVAVAGLFDKRRGLALGLVNAGAGLGSTLAPQAARALLEQFGWRDGFALTGAFGGGIAVCGLIFLVREPEVRQPVAAARPSFAFLATSEFWCIGVPILGVSIAAVGVMGTLVPFLTDRGLSLSSVTLALSSAGISSWAGRILSGYLLDHLFAPALAALSFIVALTGIGLLTGSASVPCLLTGAALVGFTLGAEGDLITFLASRYFDLSLLSRVLGVMWVAWASGGSIGTFAAGASFRLTHSYLPSWVAFALILLLSAVVVMRLPRYRYAAAVKAGDPHPASPEDAPHLAS